MRKIILVCFLSMLLCGCKGGLENIREENLDNMILSCVNGHVYIVNHVYQGWIYTPLFSADSDVPMLIRCQNKNLSEASEWR